MLEAYENNPVSVLLHAAVLHRMSADVNAIALAIYDKLYRVR